MNIIYEYAPQVALVGFFITFLWIAYSAYRPSQKQKLQAHAFIPLKEENHDR